MKQMIAAAGPLLMLAACGGEKNVSLENTQWKLQSAAGIPTGAIEAEADNFTLNFEARTVSGRTNCNLFFGEYATEGSKIEFSQMGMTRMACPDMEYEDRFTKLLDETDRFEVRGDELTLFDDSRKLAVFKKSAAAEPQQAETSDSTPAASAGK